MAGIDGVSQWSLDGGCGLMDSRMAMVPSSVMVVSTAGKMKIKPFFSERLLNGSMAVMTSLAYA
jgi:hypothetical protein